MYHRRVRGDALGRRPGPVTDISDEELTRLDARALSGFLQAQGHRWCRHAKVVVTGGSALSGCQPHRQAVTPPTWLTASM